MFETTDFAEFQSQMKARGFRFAPSHSDYPGDDGDLNSEVINANDEPVGHWGPEDEDEDGNLIFGGMLAGDADEYDLWVHEALDPEAWPDFDAMMDEMGDIGDAARNPLPTPTVRTKVWVVTVMQGHRTSGAEVLRKFGEILSQGYTDGSTKWTMALETRHDRATIREALWGEMGWVTVQTTAEYEGR